MTTLRAPRLISFVIFNPTISQNEETAHENILYFYPKETHLNTQMNEVGLCSAVSGLQNRFLTRAAESSWAVQSKPRSITTAHKRYTLRQVERDFWMVAITSRGRYWTPSNEPAPDSHPDTHNSLGGEGEMAPLMKAVNDDVDGTVEVTADNVMMCYYDTFKMMFGTFTNNFVRFTQENKPQRTILMQKLLRNGLARRCVPALANTLNIPQNFILGTLALPGAVRNAVVSYQGRVMYSTLSLSDTFTLFRLLGEKVVVPETNTGTGGGAQSPPPPPQQQGGSNNATTTTTQTYMSFNTNPGSPGDHGIEENSRSYSQLMRREEVLRSSVGPSPPRAMRTAAALKDPSPEKTSNTSASGGGGASSSNSRFDFASDTNVVGFTEELRAILSGRALDPGSMGNRSPTPNSAGTTTNNSHTTGGTGGGLDVPIPSIYINGSLVGVLTYCLKSFRIILIVEEKFVERPELCKGVMDTVQEIMEKYGHGKLQSIVLPTMKNSRDLDERYTYYYFNFMNLAMKSSLIERFLKGNKEDEASVICVMDMIRTSVFDLGQRMRTGGIGRSSQQSETDNDDHSGRPMSSAEISALIKGGGVGYGDGLDTDNATLDALQSEMALSGGQGEDHYFNLSNAHQTLLIKVRGNLYVSALLSGDREFYLAVDASSVVEALEQVRFVSKYVFVGIYVD